MNENISLIFFVKSLYIDGYIDLEKLDSGTYLSDFCSNNNTELLQGFKVGIVLFKHL